ncbi:6-hydroxymethylpterin diphosphokinase MptE-like protein [Haloarchaeobius amylolyticus]|uniref:6-hydroxymethylpterin diphosphokinase MptE-like protein n=1 Tax=Haloarchaeobius amylolyticus TaxID=1198296 RepID=UPI0022722162|nr:6-hydroxymethylpterin diphosphokinase MptE-like protein [Haloarchaeobius amylolyticus]
MDFSEFESVYERILRDFGFDREGDERARDVLRELTTSFDESRLSSLARERVAICGAAPSLADDLASLDADRIVAVSSAAAVCRDHGLDIDVYVTDLDAEPELAGVLSAEGIPTVVHAHGDNVDAVRELVPTLTQEHVLPTTQAAPVAHVRNYGGFTDGDRAAFLADHVGAGELVFPGWDFDDPSVGELKRQKLEWAARLLYWLEQRRGVTFDVLDGRRDGLELP